MEKSGGRTLVSLLTGNTRAAVAVIAVSGPRARQIVLSGFHTASPRPLLSADRGELSEIRYGHWQPADSAGEAVVVVAEAADRWEIHCHGGAAAAQRILDDLTTAGADVVAGLSWWQQYQAATDAPRLETEIVAALSHAVSQAAVGLLLSQLSDGLLPWVISARRQLADALATDPAAAADRLALIRDQAAQAQARSPLGLHLTEPWRVVIAGPPNVGKSSLINALVGFERSIAFDQPGTTRDVLEVQTVIDGWPVRLSDTAGLRTDAATSIESAGIALATEEIESADLILWVHDATQAVESVALPAAATAKPLLSVINKIDLAARPRHQVAGYQTAGYQAVAAGVTVETSATSGAGVDRLRRAIIDQLVVRPPRPGDVLPVNARQRDGLQAVAAADSVAEAIAALDRLSELPGRYHGFDPTSAGGTLGGHR